jgi:hypothetical protein
MLKMVKGSRANMKGPRQQSHPGESHIQHANRLLDRVLDVRSVEAKLQAVVVSRSVAKAKARPILETCALTAYRRVVGCKGVRVLLIVLVFTASGCKRKAAALATRAAGMSSAPAVTATPSDWTHPAHVEVLYRGKPDLGRGVRFAGVRLDTQQVVVTEETGVCKPDGKCGKPGYRIETIDLARGAVTERWDKGPGGDCPVWGAPLTPHFDDELRWAKLAHALGVPAERAYPSRFGVSPDGKHIAYMACGGGGQRPNVMAHAAANAQNPRSIAEAGQAERAFFSPDGRRLLWTHAEGGLPHSGHDKRRPTGEPRIPGEIKVARLDASPDSEVRTLHVPTMRVDATPSWSVDGSRIYFFAYTDVGTMCLSWSDTNKLGEPRALHCRPTLLQPGFAQSADGKSGIVFGHRFDTSITWLELPSGRVKATRSVPAHQRRFVKLDALGKIAVVEAEGSGIVVVDLESGKTASVKPKYGSYLGLDKTQWLDARRLLLLAYGNDEHYQLVAIDVPAVLGRAQKDSGRSY